jgi:hypothetical protein
MKLGGVRGLHTKCQSGLDMYAHRNSSTLQHVFIFSNCMRTGPIRVENFVDCQFVQAICFLVIPSEVEESLDISPRSFV